MNVIRNVIFDLGGVLLDWHPDALVAGFQPQAELRQSSHESLFGHADWRSFDRGTLTELELIERIASRTSRPAADVVAFLEAVRESLAEKPETVQLLRQLDAAGVKLFCLSNMPIPFYAYLRRRHGFWDAFTGIVISGEIKKMKPDAEVFAHLLETFDLRADECVFIDDLPANVEGARAVGMQGIVFEDAAQCAQELNRLGLSLNRRAIVKDGP